MLLFLIVLTGWQIRLDWVKTMHCKKLPGLLFVLILVACLSIIGCSYSDEPVATDSPNQSPGTNSSEIQILSAGRMNLDNGTIEPLDRGSDNYMNVTSFVGSNFSYYINGWAEPEILDITLSINNVSPFTVHDVCIVFEDLYEKAVVNPDSWTDIYDDTDVDPFIAFRKEDPTRSFPPVSDTEQLLLHYPPGALAYVDYFILAHFGGNAEDVYQISDWNVDGELTELGGSAIISVEVLDHQGDVDYVTALTSVLSGGVTNLAQSATPNIWEAAITNSAGVPAGIYPVTVFASSPALPPYTIYNFYEIEVVAVSGLTFGSDIKIEGIPIGVRAENDSDGHHSVAFDGDIVFAVFTGLVTSESGALYFVKSFNGGETWSDAVQITSTPLDKDTWPNMVVSQSGEVYITYTRIFYPGTSAEVRILKSSDAGDNWTEYYPCGGENTPSLQSSICVDTGPQKDTIVVTYVSRDWDLGDRIRVVSTTDLTIYHHVTISDNKVLSKIMEYPSIVWEEEFGHYLVAWSDGTYDLVDDGEQVVIDWADYDDITSPLWNADQMIPGAFNQGDWELNPSLAVNTRTGYLGIMYLLQYDGTGSCTVRFVHIDAEDPEYMIFGPNLQLESAPVWMSISAPSLIYDHTASRWLASWMYFRNFIEVMESVEADGNVWVNPQYINEDAGQGARNPAIASNGSDVVVSWVDYRTSTFGDFYIDHGVF